MVRTNERVSGAGGVLGVNAGDAPGLLHDRDVVAYYGDPALQARMKPGACAYEQELTKEGKVYTLTVTGMRGAESFEPVNRNGSQRGGRPVVESLPERIGKVEVLEGAEWSPVIADDFILVPNPGKGERMVVKFRETES
jgi:zinc protease